MVMICYDPGNLCDVSLFFVELLKVGMAWGVQRSNIPNLPYHFPYFPNLPLRQCKFESYPFPSKSCPSRTLHPWKSNGWNLKNHLIEMENSSSPNLHDVVFQYESSTKRRYIYIYKISPAESWSPNKASISQQNDCHGQQLTPGTPNQACGIENLNLRPRWIGPGCEWIPKTHG